MLKAILFLLIPMALACGGQDSGSAAPGTAPSAGPAKAASRDAAAKMGARAAKAEAEKTAAAEAKRAAAAGVDPKVTSCLGLIRQANYQEAVTVCAEAARIDPNNADVQAALEIAQAGGMANVSGAAADVAADAARDKANSALGDAAGKLGR